jgi:hypothetical protein
MAQLNPPSGSDGPFRAVVLPVFTFCLHFLDFFLLTPLSSVYSGSTFESDLRCFGLEFERTKRMRIFSRTASALVPGILLALAVAASAQADIVENLGFTGTATCLYPTDCSASGNGPVVGAYSFDVTTQTVVGPWSFSTPFGLISSSDTGASASTNTTFFGNGLNNTEFQELNFTPFFFEFVNLAFPTTDPQDLGAVVTGDFATGGVYGSAGCTNIPGGFSSEPGSPASPACSVDYQVSGATTQTNVTPEPSLTVLVGIGMLALVGLRLARRRLI